MSLPWSIFGLVLLGVWNIGMTIVVLKLKQNVKMFHKQTGDPEAYVKRMSLVRFNPFSDTGGDQSFVICLLDNFLNGIIITSLHGRGVTRFYAKKVVSGLPDQDLSHEEKQALNEAIK